MKQTLKFIGACLFLLALWSVLFAFAMFQGGFVSWFLFYSFLPIFMYQLLLLFYPIRNFQVTRKMPASILRRGGSATIMVQIARRFPFPLAYCILEEILPDSLEIVDDKKTAYKKVFFFGFRRHVEITYTLLDLPRGCHPLTAIRIRTGDLFGFFKKQAIFHIDDHLEVYPNIREVDWSGKPRLTEEGTAARVFLEQQGNSISGVREYVPGDRIGFIDWKQTARKNTLMTKEFEQETSEEMHLILDCAEHPGFDETAFETAVEIAYSMVIHMQKKRIPVHFWFMAKKARHFLVQNAVDLRKIDTCFMNVQPENAQFSIHLQKEMASFAGTVLMVTSHMDASFLQTVRHLQRKTSQAAVLWILPNAHLPSNEMKGMKQLEMEGIHIQWFPSESLDEPIEVMLG